VEATAGAGTLLIGSSRKTKRRHNMRSLSSMSNRARNKLRTKSNNHGNKEALRKSRSRKKPPLATAHIW